MFYYSDLNHIMIITKGYCALINTCLNSSPASQKELEIVCQGIVRPLTTGQVRPIATLVPHIHNIIASVFCHVPPFVKGVHI